MTTPIDFAALPHNVRVVALVGYYLQCWALLEGVLESTIGKVVGLTPLQEAIIVKNMQLRDKISILRAVVNIGPRLNHKEYLAALTAVADVARTERNVVAHERFSEDDKGNGIKFSIVRAKGKVTFPDVRWSAEEVLMKTERLFELTDTLDSMRRSIRPLSGPAANAMFGGLGLLGSPFPPPQDSPGLGLLGAIPQTDDEIPPSSEE